MAPSPAFLALCADPYREAMRVRLYVRLNDSSGQPGTLVEITATQEVLDLSAITRRRERAFGVVQAQAWQIQVTNIDRELLAYDLKDCWVCVRAGFQDADEWETRAQGKIKKVTYSAGGTVTLEIHDALMDILNYNLTRDIRFQSTGWASEIQVQSKAAGSSIYDTAVAIQIDNAAALDDETFVIEFTTPTAYKVVLEDGDDSQAGTIGSDLQIDNVAGDLNVLTIKSSGWDAGSGAYSTGDKFIFYTAADRTSDELTPVNMIAHLAFDVMGLSVYDVMGGAYDSDPFYDSANWGDRGADGVSAGHTIAGLWRRGTPMVDLIQDALKIVHGSIFPTPTGHLGLWVLQPSTTIAVKLNGTPGQGQIDILDDATIEDNLDDAISEVIYNYKTLDGEDASCNAVDADTALLSPRVAEVTIGWEMKGVSAQDSCDKYLNRYKSGVRQYAIPATIAAMAIEIGEGVAFSESELDLDTQQSDVTEVEELLLENRVNLKCHSDPVVNAIYFHLDSSLLNGPEVLW